MDSYLNDQSNDSMQWYIRKCRLSAAFGRWRYLCEVLDYTIVTY